MFRNLYFILLTWSLGDAAEPRSLPSVDQVRSLKDYGIYVSADGDIEAHEKTSGYRIFDYGVPPAAQVHSIEIDGGAYLVGWNNGEFGGGLKLFNKSEIDILSRKNVCGLFSVNKDHFLIMLEQFELGSSSSAIGIFSLVDKNVDIVTVQRGLPGIRAACTDAGEQFYYVTENGLSSFQVDPGLKSIRNHMHIDKTEGIGNLYPNSMILFRGKLYLGCRGGVASYDFANHLVEWIRP